MPLARPLYLQALTDYTADEFRQLVDATFPTAGVLTGSLAVTANSPVAMNVLVGTGYAVIPGRGVGNRYLLHVTATETVTVDPASAQPRIDLVIAQVQDTQYGDAASQAVCAKVTGQPGVSPVAPAVPVGAVALAQVAVAAGQNTVVAGNITDRRTIVGASQAPLPKAPLGLILPQTLGPASTTDITSAARQWVMTAPVAVTQGRRYRVSGYCNGQQITATGSASQAWVGDLVQGGGTPIVYWFSAAVNTYLIGGGNYIYTANATRTETFGINAGTTGGGIRFPANVNWIYVEDLGAP